MIPNVKKPTLVILDFMSTIRNISLKKHDIFESIFSSVEQVMTFNQIHIVYDSYLENSIKECEQQQSRWSMLICPRRLKFLFRFIVLALVKENNEIIQILSQQFFIEKSSAHVEIVASGYATDADGIVDCIVSKNGSCDTLKLFE